MTEQINDPWDAAMNAEAPTSRAVFGQVQIDVQQVVLEKGVGKVPFDGNYHSPAALRHNITIAILPLPGSPVEFPTERNILAQSKEWAGIVKPSLHALNIDLRGINGLWAHVEMVPTGRTYTNKAGQVKEATVPTFIAIYRSDDDCMAAANHFFYPDRYPTPSGAASAGTAPVGAAPTGAPPTSNGLEREKAAKFLPALWRASGGDPNRLAELIAKNPAIAVHFDLASPEVLAVIG